MDIIGKGKNKGTVLFLSEYSQRGFLSFHPYLQPTLKKYQSHRRKFYIKKSQMAIVCAAQTCSLGRCICSTTSSSTHINKICIWVKNSSIFLLRVSIIFLSYQNSSFYSGDVLLVNKSSLSISPNHGHVMKSLKQ